MFVPDVRKVDLTSLDLWLSNVARHELAAEGLPGNALGDICAPVDIAKTASRQMLGFMNEMARFAEYLIADAGGLARYDVEELNRGQRRMLHSSDRRLRPAD